MIRFIALVHRWLGVVLSPLLLMWFVSGFFMLFSGFPRVSEESQERLRLPLSTQDSLPALAPLMEGYRAGGDTLAQLTSVTLQRSQRGLSLELSGDAGRKAVDAKSGVPILPQPPTLDDLRQMTQLIKGVPPMEVDTITALQQWIPFAGRRADLPFYRVVVGDEAGTHLYFSGTSGRLLQETTRKGRFLAYLGAIPHWLYFTPVRDGT